LRRLLAIRAQSRAARTIREYGRTALAPARLSLVWTRYEQGYFKAAEAPFITPEGIGDRLGPRFNLDSCASCPAQPSEGGASPAINPQVASASAYGASNSVPSFVRANGPIREARFKVNPNGTPDSGVHAFLVVSGRVNFNGTASNCNIAQHDFAANLAHHNLSMRMSTPTYGNGLLEAIDSSTRTANLAANAEIQSRPGITGRCNHSGNTGTITRFGWKAQNSSALMFARPITSRWASRATSLRPSMTELPAAPPLPHAIATPA
jgi:hypothetical protein